MAIFQPSFVIPDARSGIGLGVIDAGQDMTVSWRINGQSALTKFQIVIYENDSNSTQVLDTGALTTGCPAYGTNSMGDIQFFSYTIPAADLYTAGMTNGKAYKLTIRQWWSVNDYVDQSSASAFITRAAPTLAMDTIGTAGVIGTRDYTFTANYAQAQGDVLNWLRWRIAYADDLNHPFFDSGNVSGTMQLSCSYDGFFTKTDAYGTDYAVRLTVQTENGVEADTGWVNFSASYTVYDTPGEVQAGCVGGTDAVLVRWSGIGYIPGTGSGNWKIEDGELTLPDGASVLWDQAGTGAMSFDAPWSVVWRGKLTNADAAIFTLGQSGGDITLTYDSATKTLALKQSGTTLVSQSGIVKQPTVTAVLTDAKLYLRVEYPSGGLYPSLTLYPSDSLYPKADDTTQVDTYELSVSYTQTAITSVSLGGVQTCIFMEVINGTASAETIAAAITDGTYTPGLSGSDYMLADWTDGLDAGSLNVGGDTITGFDIYRRQGASGRLVKITEAALDAEQVYDYGALSQQGPYTYYLFPLGTDTYIASPIQSGAVTPCWWNWTLMECAETAVKDAFTVLAAYRFRLNVETGAMSNNNAPNLLNNFTPYPKIQLAPQNYKSGTLTGLIGIVSMSGGQPQYVDTIAIREAIYALSVTRHPLFLKSRKGDLFRVKIAGAISVQTGDATREQTQTVTIPWAEVGPADGVSLYSMTYAGAQEPEGKFSPQGED